MSAPSDTARAKHGGLRRSVLSLSVVNTFEMAIQVVLPMVLVRLLTDSDFGLYRTLWLIAITCSGALALGMPGSLYYFLPRSRRRQRAIYVLQAALYMMLAGLVAAAGTAAFVLLHETGHKIGLGAIPFIGLWVFASLLDYFFTAQQLVPIQARINLSFALLRITLVMTAAMVFQQWPAVLAAQLIFVGLKAIVCAVCVARALPLSVQVNRKSLNEQVGYSLPIGTSTALFLLRGRIDQWLVASMFTVAQFGMYSIASVFAPIQTLIRLTVNQVILPEMNRMQSQQNNAEMQTLNRRSNLAVAFLIFPAIAFIGVWAEPILAVLFTNRYSAVAPIVRIYLFIMAVESIEITLILIAMRQGRFMMMVDGLVLPIAIGSALLGAYLFGVAGAAAGGVVGAVLAQSALYFRCKKLTGLPIAKLQDWRGLARIALCSGLAAVGSQSVEWFNFPEGISLKLPVAGLLFTAIYWSALRIFGAAASVRQVFGQRLASVGGF
jgi:O-antigen/teichoic acid export membrane protein